MSLSRFTFSVGALLLLSTSSHAQQAQQTELPPVTVEVAKPKAAHKTVAKKKPVAVAAPPQAPAPAEPNETAESSEKGGTGLVNGLVAKRSATASKTDAPIVEVPRTVNVVTKEQIELQQPTSVRDALAFTPNVQTTAGSASIFDEINLRGFLAPIYLDGLLTPVSPGSNARQRLEPYALERLEVLKGPASALYGQVPPGGLINGISKRPEQDAHNEIFTQFGSDNYAAAGFDFTGPVDKQGKLSYRLVGLARETDLDIDFADRERYFIAPSVTWQPSTSTTLTILGNAQRDGGYGPRQYVPLVYTKDSAPFGRISRSINLGEPSLDDYQEDQWSIGYALTHRFSEGIEFRQNVRYTDVEQENINIRMAGLGTGTTVNRNLAGTIAGFESLGIDNQVQFDFTSGALRHRLVAGLDYLHVDGDSLFSVYGVPWITPGQVFPSIDVYHPVYGNTPVTNPFTQGGAVTDNTSTMEQTGIYLQDQIKWDGWIATLGGRYDWATTDLNDLRPAAADPVQKIDDEKFTGFVGLSYVFDNGFAPYVSYSTSFLPFGGTNISSLINPSTGNPYKPTTGESYEAGIKYQPPGTDTLITAAVFEITQQNMNTTDVSTVPSTVVQTGEVRMRGFEIEAKTKLTANLDMMAGYGYVEPTITDTGNPDNVGNDFAGVSRHTASLWGTYTWHEGWLVGFAAGAGVRYVGTSFADEANTAKVPAYTLLDAMMSYDLSYLDSSLEGAKLQLNGYNLTDEYYVVNCATSAVFCQLGQSRSVLATVKYEW